MHIKYSFGSENIVYEIIDNGPGFKHAEILSISPENTNDMQLEHGRGILMACKVFDMLEYNEKGNHVKLVKLISPSA